MKPPPGGKRAQEQVAGVAQLLGDMADAADGIVNRADRAGGPDEIATGVYLLFQPIAVSPKRMRGQDGELPARPGLDGGRDVQPVDREGWLAIEAVDDAGRTADEILVGGGNSRLVGGLVDADRGTADIVLLLEEADDGDGTQRGRDDHAGFCGGCRGGFCQRGFHRWFSLLVTHALRLHSTKPVMTLPKTST